MKSLCTLHPRIPVVPRKTLDRHAPVQRNARNRRRLDEKLKKLSDEYTADQLGHGLIQQVSLQVHTFLDQNLPRGSLPRFLEDELQNTTSELCSTPHPVAIHPDCLNACTEILNTLTSPIESSETPAEITGVPQSVEPSESESACPLDGMKAFFRQLEWLYETLISRAMSNPIAEEAEQKTYNWLSILAGAIAGMQIKFLAAAMENLKTMQENSDFSLCDHATLDAMGEEERQNYLILRDESRQRFLTANNHYRVNLHMFNLTTRMFSEMLSLFNSPCRLRT